MILLLQVSVLLFTLLFSKSEIYLYNTNDGLTIDHYDCVLLGSLDYCRRPIETIDLARDDDIQLCEQNGGRLRRFSELRSTNITANTILQQWKSSLERVERYSLFLRDSNEQDGFLCQCPHRGSFGKNCEYQLPVGQTIHETLQWQLNMRMENSQKLQMYGDVICYRTLECDSGLLCLDWRDICDGIQHCMSGWDEENCDILEMNRCNDNEYRCANGMCIPGEFFLDGDLDCLDWSDEMSFKPSWECPHKSVNTECDDHLCRSNHWSCGDGQCLPNRPTVQRVSSEMTCQSGRDQYFMCETDLSNRQWTMPNGRCFRGDRYESSSVTNRNDEEQCEYLLQCLLSKGVEKNCSCDTESRCAEQLDLLCHLPLIRYPRGAVMTPFTFFLFSSQRADWTNKRADFILINGTVRCRNTSVTVSKIIPFDTNWSARGIIEEHFCRSFVSNISSSGHTACHHEAESTDLCNEWNPCLSVTRIRDGSKNCLNGHDEQTQTEMEIEKSCAHVRQHRFRCSTDEPTCLSVTTLGDHIASCRNGRDELWFGIGRTLSSLNCNNERKEQCARLRQYIEQSGTSVNHGEINGHHRIPFHSHCDTFLDLPRREDENHLECHQWWKCSEYQQRCRSGQCIEQSWSNDWEWDCADASDEYTFLNLITRQTLRQASQFDFTNQSYFVPSSCNQSYPFLCLSAKATRQGFECFDLSQIGDGHIDCAGAFDERNTLEHCSQSSPSMLGSHFRCSSSNTCIPFSLHCSNGHRCPNRSDDRLWCDRERRPSNCSGPTDFVCFDGRCVKGGRCNLQSDCPFNEDEYMCDYPSTVNGFLVPYRQFKRLGRRSSPFYFDLDANRSSSSSLSPYWCNRGLGVLQMNGSIVCLCPPQYHGEKCEYHSDRLSVILQLNLSRSGDTEEMGLKLLVLFLFNDQVLTTDQFHLHSSEQKKLMSHFLYPRSSTFVRQRRERFFNRSSLLARHPFSIRIELYRAQMNDQPAMMGVWRYPLSFSHLPVSRLAKVLHFDRPSRDRNPCSSRPCHPNAQCHQLINNRLEYVCLCPTNSSGENCSVQDERCRQGYCSTGSLCQPDSRPLLRGNSLPFCLCPLNRLGDRCSIEHGVCLSNPCQNNGWCVPGARPDHVICVCSKEYFGSHCQSKRPTMHLFLSTNLSSQGAVIQFFDIDRRSLDLMLADQHVFRILPHRIEYFHPDQLTITGIVLVKLYSTNHSALPDLHLVSHHQNVFSLNETTEISSINRCPHLQTFWNDTSPIRYHHICVTHSAHLCFRDDIYLCVCTENHTRAACFLYDDELDRCSNCLGNERCLKGHPRQSNDFLCLNSSDHSEQPNNSTPNSSQQPPNSTPNSSQQPPNSTPNSSQQPPNSTPNSSQQPPNSTRSFSPSQLTLSSPLIISLLIFSLLKDQGTIQT